MRILHIAAHMGGGIGAAYAGLGDCGQEQSILLLEPPQDAASLTRVREAGFRVIKGAGTLEAEQELRQADAVVFSWHHHPALTKFLHDIPSIPIRSILWCHVSGNYFPAIPADFVKKFDQCMFATPYSLGLPQIQGLGTAYMQEHFQVVYGLNALDRFAQIQRSPHKQFTIGYVGTMGFCKLHPEFVGFCAAVRLPDARFLMVGTPSTKDELLNAAVKNGIAGQFQFCGQLSDVTKPLAQMDIFSYLLNPQHFGATENALLEAMAAGLPVVALDQCVERHIIRDGETGLLVHSPEEYGAAVRRLYENPSRAAELGANAQSDILQSYSLRRNRERFVSSCERAVTRPNRIHSFGDFFTGGPADWFLTCAGPDRSCFAENYPEKAGLIFQEQTKGSPTHYYTYFPEDERLMRWARKTQGGDRA